MADNVTTEASHLPERAVTSFILIIVLIASIVLNVLFTIVFIRVRYARDSANYLLLNMAVADLLSSVVWLIPSIMSAAAWTWLLGDGFCHLQGFVANWCYTVNMHTFLAVAIEKFLRFWRPSKHKEVFYKTVVLVLIFGIWIFDLVIALFPLMGWGIRAFSTPQFQCTLDYKESQSNLGFTFTITFIIPLIGGMVLYALVFHKIRKVRSQIAPGKPLVLEERTDIKESYAEKFVKSQKKFRLFEVHSTAGVVQKPQNPPRDDDDPGYESDESDGGSTANNKDKTANSNTRPVQDYVAKKKPRRTYVMKMFDYKLTVTVFLAWLAYQLIWFPHIVLSFVWAYNFRPAPADGAIIFLTLVSFFSLIIKPIIYITNKGMRRSVKSAFCAGSADDRDMSKGQEYEPDYVNTATEAGTGDADTVL